MTHLFDIRNSAFGIRPVPPKGNANFAWVQHFIHHLAPQTARRDSAFLQSEASPQVVREAKDNFRKDDDVRWQPSGARQIAKGNPQGERGGVHQFYTPSCAVRCLVEMLAPYKGRIYDPACGSGGMGEVRNQNYEGRKRPQGPHQTVCAANHPPVRKLAEIHGGSGAGQTVAPLGNIRRGELPRSPSRKEQSRVHRKMWRLASGTGGIRVLAGTPRRWRNRASGQAATAPCRVRRTDRHLRHDHQTSEGERLTVLPSSFILQTSPAWVQHFIHHLAPQGMVGRCKVRATNSELRSSVRCHSTFAIQHSKFRPSSNQSGEGEIRKALIEADREMPRDELRTPNRVSHTSTFEIHPSNFASLPGQLFYSTQIPVCLWFLLKNDHAGKCRAASELELALAA